MKLKISILLAILCLFSWSCPKPPMAKIRITVDSTPILLEWNDNDGLWYMNASLTFTEIAGVGVNVDYIFLEFLRYFELPPGVTGPMTFYTRTRVGFRLDALESVTFKIEEGMKSRRLDALKITIEGSDDNGYDVKDFIEVPLDSGWR